MKGQRSRLLMAAMGALVLALIGGGRVPSASAVGFVVNSTADTPDVSTSDLVCADAGGACTLRAAIQQANFSPGPDTISFNIGGGVQTIAPASALPAITDAVTIDGTTQPGFSGTPLIEIDGIGAGSGVDGLTLNAGNITVRSLAINRFDRYGIFANNTGSAAIEGNFIGLAPDGVTARGNLSAGVFITVSGTVGGTSAAQRNVISGNGAGVVLSLGAANVRSNYIGTNASGTAAVPNGNGVLAQSAGNTIDGNVISGNSGVGVKMFGATNNTVSNNLIGTAANGTSPLGNGSHGIQFTIAQNNMVGSGNTIAYNGGAGICVCPSVDGNTFAGNSIFSNAGLGIGLGGDGVTPNDSGDGDSGANNLQNYPVLTSATSNGVSTTVTGTLNSTANGHFLIEYLSSPVCDASTHGEGQTFLVVTLSVATDGSGNASVNKAVTTSLRTGNVITTIATNDSTGDSSEFSNCVQVNCPGTPGPWAVPAGDSDCDGFTDAQEGFSGTDPAQRCAMTLWLTTKGCPMCGRWTSTMISTPTYRMC